MRVVGFRGSLSWGPFLDYGSENYNAAQASYA